MFRERRAALTWAHARRGGFPAEASELLLGFSYSQVLPRPQARGQAGSNNQFGADWPDSE